MRGGEGVTTAPTSATLTISSCQGTSVTRSWALLTQVLHQPRPLPPGLRPVADVEDGVRQVDPHVHHLAALVLALVHGQVDLAAAQSSELGDIVRRSPGVSLGEVEVVQAVAGAHQLHVPGVVEDGAEHVGVDAAGLWT